MECIKHIWLKIVRTDYSTSKINRHSASGILYIVVYMSVYSFSRGAMSGNKYQNIETGKGVNE